MKIKDQKQSVKLSAKNITKNAHKQILANNQLKQSKSKKSRKNKNDDTSRVSLMDLERELSISLDSIKQPQQPQQRNLGRSSTSNMLQTKLLANSAEKQHQSQVSVVDTTGTDLSGDNNCWNNLLELKTSMQQRQITNVNNNTLVGKHTVFWNIFCCKKQKWWY